MAMTENQIKISGFSWCLLYTSSHQHCRSL